MIGYKAFNKDLTCKGFQYEIGKTYETEEKPIICEKGFHFCKSIPDTYSFYPMSDNTRICKIEALGDIVGEKNGNKYCTNKIRVIEEITEIWERRGNSSSSSTGYCNSGYCNSSNWNSGNRNSGVFNTSKNPTIKMFDEESNWTIEDWIDSGAKSILDTCPYTYSDFITESSMTNDEKKRHPEYKTISGYIETVIVTKEDKQNWWDNLSQEDKQKCYDLPNFDKAKFEECVGIKIKEDL